MCGIAGAFNVREQAPPSEELMRSMLGTIRHRGPDQFGILLSQHAALGSARLSIIDISHGRQPISNEDRTLWIVYNGEVFNYVELRAELEAKGHHFTTRTDTEVIIHLYEQYGEACLSRLNGQFAFAILDTRNRRLFLARDRVGVRPVYHTLVNGRLLFGSEVKELFTDPEVRRALKPEVLEEIFVYWCPGSSKSLFEGIEELPPGCYLIADRRGIRIERWWDFAFTPAKELPAAVRDRSADEWGELLRHRLSEATRLRLRADVPVGAYLSGGFDSSVICALVTQVHQIPLHSFSISFTNPDYDERTFQLEAARALNTQHTAIEIDHEDISDAFPSVIWHCETALTRTSPVPLFLLSKAVQAAGIKVVLTGEGADEFLGGYDLFKENKIRRFWARVPDSKWRSRLLSRLYEDIPGITRLNTAYLAKFFQEGLTETGLPYYSHLVRWRNNQRCCRFFSASLQQKLNLQKHRLWDTLIAPKGFSSWTPLEQAQHWEIKLFLSRYLLSSQGDRVGMAHSIEGRFPFLDREVLELCAQLPSHLKLRGLTEKFILRKALGNLLPPVIAQRPKRPYRAPIHRSFFHAKTPSYVRALLSPESVEAAGWFNAGAVSQLVARVDSGRPLGETDDMALAGILSTQLVHEQFIHRFQPPPPLSEKEDVAVIKTAHDLR